MTKFATLRVQILEVKDLKPKESSAAVKLRDPFVTVAIGDQIHKTPILRKTNHPKWAAGNIFDFIVTPVLTHESIIITVLDKELLSTDFLGIVKMSISSVLNRSRLPFEHPDHTGAWFPLVARQHKETVSGEIFIKTGFVGALDESMLNLIESVLTTTAINYNMTSSSGPSSEEGFAPQDNMLISSQELLGASTPSTSAPQIPPATLVALDMGSIQAGHEAVGILELEILSAQNIYRTGVNMECFASIHFGTNQSFRTQSCKNSRNPKWLERVVLNLNYADIKSERHLQLAVYVFAPGQSANDVWGSMEISIAEIIAASPKPVTLVNRESNFTPVSLSLPLHGAEITGASIQFRCVFIPFRELRRRFWISVMKATSNRANRYLINKVETTTFLDAIGSTFSEEILELLFINRQQQFLEEVTFEELFESLEFRIHRSDLSRNLLSERMVQLTRCPYCTHKFNIYQNSDFEMINHISLCFYEYPKIEKLFYGGFISDSVTPFIWFTKIIATGGNRSTDDKKGGSITIIDRANGQMFQEKMTDMTRIGIRLFFQRSGTFSLTEVEHCTAMLKHMTVEAGRRFDLPSSKEDIAQFIANYKVNMIEVLNPLDSFQTLNAFYSRKLKKGSRYLASLDTSCAVSPADSRVTVFETVTQSTDFWVKGRQFTVQQLLGSSDPSVAAPYIDGSMAIFRLAMGDYHRFHVPIEGRLEQAPQNIPGAYYSLHPYALRSEGSIDLLSENVRSVVYLDSPLCGRVAMVVVGGLLTGSIRFTSRNAPCDLRRLEEMGYFAFGGSTIILLFSPGQIKFDADLLANTERGLETLIRVGNSIGILQALKGGEP